MMYGHLIIMRTGSLPQEARRLAAGAAVITFSVEVITLPVSDVDRALRLCRSGWFHARRRLCAERRISRRSAHAAGLRLLDPDRQRTYQCTGWINSQHLS